MKTIKPGTILITEGTSAPAQRLATRQLSDWPVHFGSSADIPGVLLSTGRYHRLPAVGSDVFLHELLKLSLDLGVAYILPMHQEEVSVLNNSSLLFLEYGVEILSLCTNPDGESYLCSANDPHGE